MMYRIIRNCRGCQVRFKSHHAKCPKCRDIGKVLAEHKPKHKQRAVNCEQAREILKSLDLVVTIPRHVCDCCEIRFDHWCPTRIGKHGLRQWCDQTKCQIAAQLAANEKREAVLV